MARANRAKFGLFLLVMALAYSASSVYSATAAHAESTDAGLWLTSAEVGVGPVDEDIFLHLTPRLNYLRPVPMWGCTSDPCQTFFEAALQVPLRLRLADRDPQQSAFLRQEDWQTATDYFRIIRRLEYGSSSSPIHVKVGELGPVNLGQSTIVNGYYNVITTDHYRLGLQGRIDRKRWGAEILINDLTAPNLLGFRASGRPDFLYDSRSWWRRFTAGITVVSDTNAPTLLARGDAETIAAGPDLRPLVELARPLLIGGVDMRWHAYRGERLALTPYTDLNHHFGYGTGAHTGVLVDADLGDNIALSARAEYRLLGQRYVPDYIDPIYEVTRFQHPAYDEPTLAGPKLRAAASMESATRHGGYAQFQARFFDRLALSAAYADATGPTGASLRLRASLTIEERTQVGLFYYKFAPGTQRFTNALAEVINPDAALVAAEARVNIWGPFYAQGQFGQQWRLADDGTFTNVHLFNLGFGASFAFQSSHR